MEPLLFNAMRYLTCLLALVPTLVLAQPAAPEPPCLPPTPALADMPPLPTPAPILAMLPQIGGPRQQECSQPEAEMIFSIERRKSVDKTFKVSKSDVLRIENKFGNVHVSTWNRNEIQVKVDIISRANTEQAAEEMLNRISVAESRSGSTIQFKTEMGSIKSSGKQSFEINYTVNMPEDNQLAVHNSFGNVYLPDMKGKVDLTVRYGAFKAGNLSNATNSIKASFCNSTTNTIGHLNKGAVELAYSTLNLGTTNGVNGSSKFSDLKIGSLSEALEMDVKYGTFRVDNVKKNFKSINVNGGFTPIQFHFENDSAFDFDVNVQFADFKVDRDLVKFTTLQKGHTSAEYKGKFGAASSKGTISITSKYNDVKFTK